MEEYIREASQTGYVNKRLEYQENDESSKEDSKSSETGEPHENGEQYEEVNEEDSVADEEVHSKEEEEEEEVAVEPPPFISSDDDYNYNSTILRTVVSRGNQCYLFTTNVTNVFPQVSLNFAGGASMLLRSRDYLIQQNSIGGAAMWCIGFQKIQGQGVTILGGSLLVNVSAATCTGRSEYVNVGEVGGSISLLQLTRTRFLGFPCASNTNLLLWILIAFIHCKKYSFSYAYSFVGIYLSQ
ncbi:uncharacterized protein [Phaseolus vulgaris]